MNIFNKNLIDISKEDIQSLVEKEIEEGVYVDYKEELKIETGDDKKEFLNDVVSFANTDGGYLIFGIKEENKKPIELKPISIDNIDKLEQKINQIVLENSNIEPRIKHILKSIELDNGKYILVLEVIKTFNGPHRSNKTKFYARNSAGKYELSVMELKNAFLSSETLNKKIEDFISDRISKVYNKSSNGLLMHLVPLDSFYSNKQIDIDSIKSGSIGGKNIKPMYVSGWNSPKYNLNGIIVDIDSSYTQFYRNGVIEIFENLILSHKSIPYVALEKEIIEYLTEIIEVLKLIKVECPIIIFITFLGVNGYIIPRGHFDIDNINAQSIEEEILRLPEIYFEDYLLIKDLSKLLKPSFDVYWNACGYKESKNYDASGEFNPK